MDDQRLPRRSPATCRAVIGRRLGWSPASVVTLAVSLLAFTAAPHEALALPHAAEPRSPYEEESLSMVLEEKGWALEEYPEGKRIESVEVVPLDIFDKRDALPDWVKDVGNWFHFTTQPGVLHLESRLAPGQVFRQDLAAETERALRSYPRLSLVLCVAVRGSSPDKVRVVIVTKDVWSLRLNSNVRFAGGALEKLELQPSEDNLLGTHQSVGGIFRLDPMTMELGASYYLPRIVGSQVSARVEGGAILNQSSGETEGSFGAFRYGVPLRDTASRWAWGADIAWRDAMFRRYVGSAVRAYDAPSTPEPDLMPFAYRSEQMAARYSVTRSVGVDLKNDFTLAFQFDRRAYRVPDADQLEAAVIADFERDILPVSDTRIGPMLQWHGYNNRYETFHVVERLGLEEEFRNGYDTYVSVYPVLQGLGSTRDFFGAYAALSYSWMPANSLIRLLAETTTEVETHRIADGSVLGAARFVSPSFGIGRLVLDGRVLNRYENYLNRQSSLGGDTRLRGYPSGALVGAHVVAANIEFRSRPIIESSILHGALVAFADAGDAFEAFDGWGATDLKTSAGVGIRALVPQLDRIAIRVDWAFPFAPGAIGPRTFPGDVIVAIGQAFPVPRLPTVSEIE